MEKLYELQAQVLRENGELIKNQTSLQTQMTDLRKENEELRRNQTLLMHENGKIKTQLNKTMTILNDLKGHNEELKNNHTLFQHEGLKELRTENEEIRENQTLLTQGYSAMQTRVNQTMILVSGLKRDNEELSMNQTRLQHECSTCETDNIKQQSLISGLQTELLSLTKSVSTIQPGDVKLNLLNSTIQALHTVHSSTASIVTSLQGKQKTLDGSINFLHTSLDHLRGSVGIDVSYFIK